MRSCVVNAYLCHDSTSSWTRLWVILQRTEHVNMFNDIHWYLSPSASSKPSPTTPALLLQSQIASQRLEEVGSVWANHNLTHLFSDLTSWREFSLFFSLFSKMCLCDTKVTCVCFGTWPERSAPTNGVKFKGGEMTWWKSHNMFVSLLEPETIDWGKERLSE